MPSRCESFWPPSFNSAHKQAPYAAEVMLSRSLCTASAQRCTQTCMSSQLDTRPESIPFSCLSFTADTREQTRLCVWTCHLLLLLNKSLASHHSNLYGNQCWQAVRAWFTASSQQRELVSSESPCDWLPSRPQTLFCYPGLMSLHFMASEALWKSDSEIDIRH